MKVAFLTNNPKKPSFRFRITQYVNFLNKHNISSQTFILSKNLLCRIKLYFILKSFDCVILHRNLLSIIDMFFLRKVSQRLIFDFDDAIIYNDPNKKKLISCKKQNRFNRIIKQSDQIIAGNQFLKKLAIEQNTCSDIKDKIIIIPTPIDTEKFISEKKSPKTKKEIIIGWIGSSSTLIYLEDIKDVLDKLYRTHNNIKLKIVADNFFDCKSIPVIKKDWSQSDEISDIQSFDIGIMPLRNDNWSRGKCGFKLIQYLSCGIAAVCSPVGINKEIVYDNKNGFFAKNQQEWEEKISSLIEDKNLRKQFGIEGRKIIEQKYSVNVNATKLMNFLHQK